MNLPNRITLLRLVLAALFVIAASFQTHLGDLLALGAFILAAISDFFDGYLARKLKLVTSFGKLLDPLADKILVCSAYVLLTHRGVCPAWVTCLILTREFLVTGLRQIAIENGAVIAADGLGKWKTTFQLSFIITCFTNFAFQPLSDKSDFFAFFASLSKTDGAFYSVTLWGALILTVVSGLNYTLQSKGLLR